MLISLHKQATTTPRTRAAIQASTEPGWMVAERSAISEKTGWKWRKRDSVNDRKCLRRHGVGDLRELKPKAPRL